MYCLLSCNQPQYFINVFVSNQSTTSTEAQGLRQDLKFWVCISKKKLDV